MKNLFAFGIAVLCAVGTCFAAQQGAIVNGEYVITVAAGDPDVTLNADDATALGTSVNLVKKGEGRLIVSTDLSAQNWKGAVRVEAGYFKPTVAGACGTRDAAGLEIQSGATCEYATTAYMTCRTLKFGGAGVGGTQGAIRLGVNNNATMLDRPNNSDYQKVTVTDDALIAIPYSRNFQFRYGTQFNMGGKKVTVEGPGVFCLMGSMSNPGDFEVTGSATLLFEQINLQGSSANTLTVNNGCRVRFANNHPTWTMRVKGTCYVGTSGWVVTTMASQNYPNFGCGWDGPIQLDDNATLTVDVNDTKNSTSTNTFYIAGQISGNGGLKVTRGYLKLTNSNNTFTGAVTQTGVQSFLIATRFGALPALYDGADIAVSNNWVDVTAVEGETPLTDANLTACYERHRSIFLSKKLKLNMDFDYSYGADMSSPAALTHGGTGAFTVGGDVTGNVVDLVNDGGTLSLAANKEHDFHNMYVRGGTVNFHSAGYVDLVLSTNYIGASYPDIACLHITNTVVDMRANPEDNSPMQRTVIGGDGTATQQRGMLVIGEGACVTGQVYIGGSGAKGMGTLLIQGGSLLFPFLQNGVSSIAVGNGQQGYLRIDSGKVEYAGVWADIGGSANGYGVFELNGGEYAMSRCIGIKYLGGNASALVRGGTLRNTYSSGGLAISRTLWGSRTASGGEGRLTVAGTGTVDIAGIVQLGGVSNSVSMLNLNGGTLQCRYVQAITNNTLSLGGAASNWPCEYDLATAQRYIYMNGGTLKANDVNNTFIWPQMTRVTVGPGGAVFDTNGRTMTLPATLQAPAGKGVASVPFSCSEAWRYIGSPFIKITGDGAGASAHAEFDPVAGTITNVTVTSPGNGYTTATAQISYGGWTNTVSLSLDQCLDDNDTSGGLVKKGAGTLRLDAVNTYLGPTVVEAGTLRFNVDNAIAAASALRVERDATADLNGKVLTVSGLAGAGTVSGSLTVAGTWKIDAAKLVTGETLGVNGTVTIAPGTTIHVDDPDGLLLNKATWRTYTPFTATAISGPAMLAIDNLDPPWYATVSGSKMHVGYLNGTMLIFR